MDLAELEAFAASLGEKPFRARQVRKWLYNRGVGDASEMTDLSKPLRGRLAESAAISRPDLVEVRTSEDGSQKFLWRLEDGTRVESVLIPERDHLTLCLSSQVGCAMGCRFCRTAELGFTRDLTQAEILNQVLGVRERLPAGPPLKNLVFMGMGEPLANLENVVRALRILTEPGLMGFSRRHMSVSTVGLVPELARLAEQVTVGLTVSLNAADDETRSRLMPVNQRYNLEELHRALAAFPLPSRRMITIAYVLLAGVNDTTRHARDLIRFVHGLRVKINLIPFNPFPGAAFETPSEETVQAFQEVLIKARLTVIVRASKGRDIAAACGQLAGQEAEEAARAEEPAGTPA
jgi:23S rRNA (adenine2503-C2)-methyltransferase